MQALHEHAMVCMVETSYAGMGCMACLQTPVLLARMDELETKL